MNRLARLLCPLLLATLAGSAHGQTESGLQAAVRLVSAGEYVAAWESAEGEPDPKFACYAKLHVLYQSGALVEAFRVALEGLAQWPEDSWLLSQSALLALTLGEAELSDELYSKIREMEGESQAWKGVEAIAEEARDLKGQRLQERQSLQRAKWVVGLAALSMGMLALAFARTTRSK